MLKAFSKPPNLWGDRYHSLSQNQSEDQEIYLLLRPQISLPPLYCEPQGLNTSKPHLCLRLLYLGMGYLSARRIAKALPLQAADEQFPSIRGIADASDCEQQ